ncbi:DNA-binding GntR family transcriptional regulator [Angulomicrobium tetraedrale]|uniref:DNA-binding GntR family transcriptional regulator n=1 Tax=Ancylobacter tetraedralis TaxID=217068 RepID=A0A839ZHK2_9HYPH|nr:GntR family transcriptional regulator [Ancylobacter tetraedralis]MBB3774015.1 DNA-binding GntR family transcriptional regulator [Ancylobacter tetraedralis]
MKRDGDRFHPGSQPSGCLGGDRRHQVYRALKTRALLYRFRPGQHLAVVELSDQLKVSNTPVREALIRLHAEGHIAAVPARGFFARELRLREMQEIHDLLQLLIRHSLEVGACQASLRPLPDLGPPPLTPCDPRTAVALARRTEALFIAMSRCTGSDVIERNVIDLCERTHHVRRCAYRSSDLPRSLHASLIALASALAEGRMEAAQGALNDHFRVLEVALPDLVMRALATSLMQE